LGNKGDDRENPLGTLQPKTTKGNTLIAESKGIRPKSIDNLKRRKSQ
jgi:hypothetical protein